MDADHYGFVELSYSRPAKTNLGRRLERYVDRAAEEAEAKAGFEVLLDGDPVCRFKFQTPATFPVAVGTHELRVRHWTNRKSDRFIKKMYQMERWAPVYKAAPFHFSISEGERLKLSWGKQRLASVTLRISQLDTSDDVAVGTPSESRSWPAPSHEEVEKLVEPPVPQDRGSRSIPSLDSVLPQEGDSTTAGRVTHSGECRYELREIVPIPYVGPGQRHVWRASAETMDSQREPETGIRVQGAVSLGWVSLSLSKRLGVAPSAERVKRQRQELELTLDGDRSGEWEIRVFDVWQIVDVETSTGDRVTAEYLSTPSAVAVPK